MGLHKTIIFSNWCVIVKRLKIGFGCTWFYTIKYQLSSEWMDLDVLGRYLIIKIVGKQNAI